MKTGHLQEVFGCFGGRVVCGDDVWIKERGGKGKPGPDCFLVAAREVLGRNVGGKMGKGEGEGAEGEGEREREGEECNVEEREERSRGLVFEDAIPGVIAGKRAGMNGAFFVFVVHFTPDPLLSVFMFGFAVFLFGWVSGADWIFFLLLLCYYGHSRLGPRSEPAQARHGRDP